MSPSTRASDLLGISPVLCHHHRVGNWKLPRGMPSFPGSDQPSPDMLHRGTMFGATARAKLVEAAESAMGCLHSAEFEAPLMKKWHWLHWLLHMPDFLQEHTTLPSTCTTERKHKTSSAYATRLQKTGAFERNLDQVVAMEITTLREPGLFQDTCSWRSQRSPRNSSSSSSATLWKAQQMKPWLPRVPSSPGAAPFTHQDGHWPSRAPSGIRCAEGRTSPTLDSHGGQSIPLCEVLHHQ